MSTDYVPGYTANDECVHCEAHISDPHHPQCQADSDREPYRPGHATMNEETPQSWPELFTDDEVRAEVSYLLNLNKRYGTHILRVQAYTALLDVLAARGVAA